MKKLIDYFKEQKKTDKISHSYLIGNVFYDDVKEEIEEIINNILINSKMKIEENPDVIILKNREEKIGKDDIVNLIDNVNKTSQFHDGKVYIIENTEELNDSACNSLLKTLEEPPKGVYALLLTSNINNVKETIYSRCQKLFISSETEDENYDENIDLITDDIINMIEENKEKTISRKYKIYSIIEDRNMFNDILKRMLIKYKYKLEKALNENKEKEIEAISNKIIVINNNINRMKYPLNKNMSIDRLIIEMVRCEDENCKSRI